MLVHLYDSWYLWLGKLQKLAGFLRSVHWLLTDIPNCLAQMQAYTHTSFCCVKKHLYCLEQNAAYIAPLEQNVVCIALLEQNAVYIVPIKQNATSLPIV